jgi:hypothetical protein
VTCSRNVLLEQWTLSASECKAEFGVVREGIQYGKEDHKCSELTKFVRRCGHEETVPCNQAFEMTKGTGVKPCDVRIHAINPYCGRELLNIDSLHLDFYLFSTAF